MKVIVCVAVGIFIAALVAGGFDEQMEAERLTVSALREWKACMVGMMIASLMILFSCLLTVMFPEQKDGLKKRSPEDPQPVVPPVKPLENQVGRTDALASYGKDATDSVLRALSDFELTEEEFDAKRLARPPRHGN